MLMTVLYFICRSSSFAIHDEECPVQVFPKDFRFAPFGYKVFPDLVGFDRIVNVLLLLN